MDEEKKMTEEEAGQKAKEMDQLGKRIAEQHASAFEAWLKEHQDATKDEAHERLAKTIEAAMMTQLIMFTVL